MDLLIKGSIAILFIALAVHYALEILFHLRRTVLVKRNAEIERNLLRACVEQIMDKRHFEWSKNEFSWNGYRKFQIVRKVAEACDVASFYLAPHDQKPLPPFLPGQYLTFKIDITDSKTELAPSRLEGKSLIRCYSLSDSPHHPNYYRVTIKKVPSPPGKPDIPPGLVSGYFHDCLKEGDIVDVKAPAGRFTLDMTKQTPLVLIAGGIGITPLLAMLNSIAEADSTRETWFFYGVRNGSEQILKDHLNRIALEHPNVHLQVCYSNPAEKEVKGKDYHHGERVSVDLFKRLLPSSNYEFYLCGPPPMMNQITQDLKAWGVPEGKIFFEAFGAASVKKMAASGVSEGAAARPSFTVNFEKSGRSSRWEGGIGSLLELAEKCGVSIDFGCRAGNCGTCLTAIKSGEVSYLVEHGAKPETGSCLTCISIPKTDLVLDA